MTILLHIAHSQNSAMLIDEIENGIHHTRHAKLWEQLMSFADSYDTQVFAATHSWEYLEAGLPVLDKFASDFTLIQVSQDDGISNAFVVSGRDAAAAIRNGIDVRGRGRRGANSDP
jgi:AAA15 family ATPase/GTPase